MDGAKVSYKRRFQAWAYTVGHGQLLLRSTKTESFPTRIDILFKDVSAIRLPTLMEELTVAEASEADREKLNVLVHCSKLKTRKVFVIRGTDFTGYVVAGFMGVHEDQGEYDDPSYFSFTFDV